MKKLAILFPGAGYGLESPLLYYADFLYEANGFERIHMNYQDILLNMDLSTEDKIEKVREYIWKQVENIDFSIYKEIVFISKSIGCVEAGNLAERLNLDVKQVFLTPVEEAVSYCNAGNTIVIGTHDKAYEFYKNHCDKNDIKALYVKGANHSLEVEGQPYESMDALKNVMRFIER